MPNEERSALLQQCLTAMASYLEPGTEVRDPQMMEELRDEIERALDSLESDD